MRSRKVKIAFAIIIGIAIPGWVLWKNIFPSFKYEFNLAENNRDRIAEKIINNKRQIIYPVDVLDTKGDYLFDKIIFEVEFDKEITAGDFSVNAIDGLEALLYPISQKIEDEKQLESFLAYENSSAYRNGSIFAHDDSAYFVSRGKYLPIFSADVFTRSGFQWEKLITANSNALVDLKEGEKFHYYSPHPDGTILRIDKKDYYLVWEKQLLPVTEELLLKTWPDFNWADVQSNKKLSGACQTSGKKAQCQFSDLSKRQGSAYLFEITEQNIPIKEVKIKLKTSLSRDLKGTLALFLQRIKNEAAYKYGKYL